MASKRKLISIDLETWLALYQLSRDSGKDLQALADEAFADLLIKHRRPRTLRRDMEADAVGLDEEMLDHGCQLSALSCRQ